MVITTTINGLDVEWDDSVSIQAVSYTCGYCGYFVSSNIGYTSKSRQKDKSGWPSNIGNIYICSSCGKPSYKLKDQITPGAKFGSDVDNIKDVNLKILYDEARSCIQVNAFTASVMCSRKILMNIAVDKGEKQGKSFAQYVDYLAEEGYVTKSSKPWVDKIRTKGNEANHNIKILDREDAEELIKFVEMILKTNYEYPAIGEEVGVKEVKT